GLLGAGIGTFAALIGLWASVDYVRSIPEDPQPGGKLATRQELNGVAIFSTCLLAIMTIGCVGVGLIALRFSAIDRSRRRASAGTIAAEMEAIRKGFDAVTAIAPA